MFVLYSITGLASWVIGWKLASWQIAREQAKFIDSWNECTKGCPQMPRLIVRKGCVTADWAMKEAERANIAEVEQHNILIEVSEGLGDPDVTLDTIREAWRWSS